MVLRIAMVGAAYYAAAEAGLRLALVEENVTPLWPPTGIAVGAFLLLGRGVWPGVALAAFLVNLPISTSPLAAAVTAAGNTLAPYVAAVLLERVGFRNEIDRVRDAMAIVFLAALGAMLISATVGAVTLAASGAIPASDLPGAWAVWWAGDAMGVLVVAPFLLALFHGDGIDPPVRGSWVRWVEAVVLAVLLVGMTAVAMDSHLRIIFLVLPLLGWAAWRFQQRGAAPAALVVVGIASWASARNPSLFGGRGLLELVLPLQAFNASVALTSFFYAAAVTERIRARSALQRDAADLERRVETEHRIAETLQRALLPERLPEVPGVGLAARYVPAPADAEVGGDWYDVVELPNGHLGVAVGDVAGHGLRAAATMGQLRMALRAFAVEEPSPAAVVERLERMVQRLATGELATLVYLVHDPDTGAIRLVNAGHPPPLLIPPTGPARYLAGTPAPPLGATPGGQRYAETTLRLDEGWTVVLYTDGLVERRDVSLDVGLDTLRAVASGARLDLDALCDRVIARLTGPHVTDDVAVLALRATPVSGRLLRLTVPAEPEMLAPVRRSVRRWLTATGASEQAAADVVVAIGEACSNAIQHAYGAAEGTMEIILELAGHDVIATVRDTGTWRPGHDGEGGRGLILMRGLMGSVEVDRGPGGTTVRLRRRLSEPVDV